MKVLDELKKDRRLTIEGRYPYIPKYRIYHGIISGKDFGYRKWSVIFGYDEAGTMEHVSISCMDNKALPTWEIMAKLKDMFFAPEEMVVQIHPAEKRYVHEVNGLGNVLHLWRPMDGNWEALNHPERWD